VAFVVLAQFATFPDGGRKAGISPEADIALLSMLVYEFTP
jgi:hypothetical protein